MLDNLTYLVKKEGVKEKREKKKVRERKKRRMEGKEKRRKWKKGKKEREKKNKKAKMNRHMWKRFIYIQEKLLLVKNYRKEYRGLT